MINRLLAGKLKQASKKFPVVALVGPRQSGKTTLAQSTFPSKPYVTLEDPDVREFALSDPRGFLGNYPKGAILDEVQRAPQIFSYLQGIVDRNAKPGFFILTGSHHFLLLEHLSQTLAGRVKLLTLLPFSLEEIKPAFKLSSLEEVIFKGLYPRIYDKKIHPRDWYPSYIQTYLERDVRAIKNVDNLNTFQKFIRMCASRTSQLLNLSSLAGDCGVTHNTVLAWIGILEASFVVYLLKPYHQNFGKRLVKAPKLYFYDTGLVCSLLGIEKKEQLKTHPLRGALFETMIMAELIKNRFNQGLLSNIYFWRDKTGHEIDCVIEKGSGTIQVELKSSKTIAPDFFKGLDYYSGLNHKNHNKSFLIYAGEGQQRRQSTAVLDWKAMGPLLELA